MIMESHHTEFTTPRQPAERAESSFESTEEKDIGRRKFLKFSAGAAALMALNGCHKEISPEKAMRAAELLEPHPFTERWRTVLAETLSVLDVNEEIRGLLGDERLRDLKEALETFDVQKYIATLSRRSGVPPEKINAELLTFSIESSKEDGTMAEVSKEARALTLFLGERVLEKTSVKHGAIHQILRHELAHLFSFNFNADEAALRAQHIPWMKPSSDMNEMLFVNPALYEGATEIVALLGSEDARYQKGMEQGYRGGATLSAYALAALAGERAFTQSYLKKDNRILARALNEKIGDGASFFFTEPMSPELLLGGHHENLEILYFE